MVRIRYVYSRGEIVKTFHHLAYSVTNWLHFLNKENTEKNNNPVTICILYIIMA